MSACTASSLPSLSPNTKIGQAVKERKRTPNKKSATEKEHHYPFITKIQVKIIRSTAMDEPEPSRTYSRHTIPCTRLLNLTVDNSFDRSPSSKSSYYGQAPNKSRLHQVSSEEQRRRRILGTMASAHSNTTQEKELLYRPRFRSKDCGLQLLLVKELTQHLTCSRKNARNSRPTSVFHARSTKGEKSLGIGR